jgi:excisionase family DNA binding protein
MNDLLTPSEFRKHVTGLPRAAMYRMLKEGRIKAIRLGQRDYRIPKQEIEDFVIRELGEQVPEKESV